MAPPGRDRRDSATGETPGRPATVWVLGDDGTPRSVDIRIGATDGTSTRVLEGPLAAGDEVIVDVIVAERG